MADLCEQSTEAAMPVSAATSPLRRAVLVDDDGHVDVAGLELAEELGDGRQLDRYRST